jgi:eukaryotic-like serine/threonine-protein kinase
MAASVSQTDLDDTIRVRIQTLSPLAATIARDPRATLVPSSDAPPHSGKTALAALRKIQRDPQALRVADRLGEGGMGVVHTGHQVALDRRVAVKTLRREHLSDENVESLLGEAWLAGSLEHPNVVPIYDLGLDESGAPLLVMKRIEGDTWADLLIDSKATQRHSLDRDPLEFHLRVLIQVCNAIHFAHSRSVVHRDLKPDNVMVGHFGEVYVLDWGVATRPGPVRHVAGTLVYMAPEMLGGLGEISARTDVYLLGSVLYEVLTGRAPHEGTSMQPMVASVILSEPKLPESAPPELADLVVRCMKRDPEERPESALAVRRAIELFLEHRGAMALAHEALERLSELETLLASKDTERAYNVFGATRFGFKQALRAWSESSVAKDGLRRAISLMVQFEAERGEPRAAALLLSELESSERDPALEALVEAARKHAEDEAKKIEQLRELERDLDPRAGRQARLIGGLGFGVLWSIVPFLAPRWVSAHPDQEGLASVPISLLSVLIMAVGYRVFRAQSRINRQLLSAFTFALAMQPVLMFAAKYLTHMEGKYAVVVLMAYWCMSMGMITAAVEKRLVPLPVAYAIGFLVATLAPEYRYDAVAGANLIAVVTVAIIWSRRGTERAIEREALRKERGTAC